MIRILILIAALFASPAFADDTQIILQSTTSTQNSGLLDAILPIFEEKTGYDVRVVAVGTGQAMKNARNGDGDLVLVHARTLEDQFVAEGWGTARHDVMYNDFVIVGPNTDPAGIAGSATAALAFDAISKSGILFASRGDNSGTHVKELEIWRAAGGDPVPNSGKWYRETGSGMGATLNASVEMRAYTLTDRGTWKSFGNRRDHVILFEGDPMLFNPYGIIAVNPERHPHVNHEGAKSLIEWLTGEEGQAAIADFRIDGEQLFFPAAEPSD